ncbi:hypothetical protein [Candidatus Odyssella acanthamoebae]|uniref:Uncharacterized protein n=1 Tax=Candidatus Odyssella acanthamoebae TaxID=91604 RepID=A0A077AWR9_9PROT|nr:hypothetical protein [Candidatus Paracaedibacter acanthamoebae]AIK96093.1 hypothetical protein ID47_04060 [Candidatus Paracaedibacter acanthamoebae]
MMNKTFFSIAAFMIALTSNTFACESMALDPIYKYDDCINKVKETFKKRANYFKTSTEAEKAVLMEDIAEMAQYEEHRCQKTCRDAPQTAVAD